VSCLPGRKWLLLKGVSSRVSVTLVDIETLKTSVTFCGVGLFVSLLLTAWPRFEWPISLDAAVFFFRGP
jgi:hypothetical protein